MEEESVLTRDNQKQGPQQMFRLTIIFMTVAFDNYSLEVACV